MVYSSRDMETFEIHHVRPQKNQKGVFRDFWLPEGYKLRTPKVNSFLWSFLGGNQLYTIGDSRDMENHAILLLLGPKKQKIVFLRHFRLSEWYKYLRLSTVNQVLQPF